MIKIPLRQVELNITELCNRKCSFCPRAYDYPNENFHMSVEVAEQAMIQTKEYTDFITIAGRGEPLLCKNLYEILELIPKHKKFLKFITNGDHLEKHIDEIHKIIDLNSINVKFLINCYDGLEQYEERKRKWIHFKSVECLNKRREDDKNYLNHLIYNHKVTNRGGYLPWTKSSVLDLPCYQLFDKTMINWNGDVNLCCHDWTVETFFGNILEKKFQEIWEEGLLNEYRMKLTKYGGRGCFRECMECDSDQEYSRIEERYKRWKNGEIFASKKYKE